MVVRETLQMAESLVRSELRVPAQASVEPLTVDVLGDRGVDSTTSLSADEPTYEVKQGNTRLSSQNLAALTTGLKIMTSLRGHLVTKVKNVDGLSASSRRSDEDDGYCSRSSLDSPVQINRPDAISPTTEESLETFTEGPNKNGLQSSPASPLPITGSGQGEESIRSCDGANDELKLDCNSQTVAAVASLDHCYLMAKAPSSALSDGQLPSPADGGDEPQTQLVDSNGGTLSAAAMDDTAGKSLSSAARRNISIFVVPQPMPSSGLRWRARIIRADASSSEEMNGTADAGQGTSSCGDVELTSRQGSTIPASTSSSTSWLPLSAVAGPDCGRVKSTVGTTAPTHVAPGRRPNGYRQRLTVGSRLAALTATADSLSRQIARVAASSARTGGREVRRHNASQRRRSADYHLRDLSVRLHPLVDHDYGAFATFNAEVQSSIISTTTDGVSQLDWRSIRRNRPATSASARPKPAVSDATVQQIGSTADAEVRPKRKYCRRQPQDLVYGLASSYVGPRVTAPKTQQRVAGRKGRPPSSLDARRQQVARKRPLDPPSSVSVTSDDGKSYVKIPGHYQDDFIYYATKRARGRPRKSLQDATMSMHAAATGHTSARPTAVGGINVFDWYREMAQTDKSSRFGVPTTTANEVKRPHEASPGWADTTPVDESAVADLVMDMLPSSTATSTSVTADYASGTFSSAGERSELTVTEEDVCAMLRSLNEADLKMIESHLDNAAVDHEDDAKTGGTFDDDDKVEVDTGGDGNLSQYLNEYGRDSLLPMSQASTSSGLLDVDEINHGDLLSADIGNMHVILSDLRSPSRDLRTSHLPVTSKSNLSALFETTDYTIGTGEFHEPADVPAQNSVPETSVVAPPELCVVNMFWNDLPGLMMEGREYVRLVDIHRQVLPAKDTGILKKRCYMLGLDVRQCSELQRDFLIRYMNAAKSKSTVVVSRTDAIHLIGFYVTPKSKTRGADVDDAVLDSHRATTSRLTVNPGSGQQSMAVSSQPPAVQPSTSSTPQMMTQNDRLSPPQATITAVEFGNRRHSDGEKLSSPEGVKRSERLRDRRVHYVDMVHGIHPRHSAADGADVESKTGETGRQQSSQSSVNAGLRRVGSSARMGGRTSSTERRMKLDVVEPVHVTASSGSRRKSLELRAATVEVVDKPELMNPSSAGPSVSPLGGRLRLSSSGSRQALLEDVPQTRAANVKHNAERSSAKSAAASNRRHRSGSTRLRRRMAARRRSKLLSLSTQLTQPSLDPTSQMNTSSQVDCSQQKVAATDSHKVDKQTDSSPVESVKFTGLPGVANNTSGKMLKMGGDIVKTGDLVEGTAKTLLNETLVSVMLPVCHSLCDGFESCRLKHCMPSTNVIPVMHVNLSKRAGRRCRGQFGNVLLDRYLSVDAACIRCCSCSELFSVAEFVRHMHHRNRIAVASGRRLGPRGVAGLEWHEFQRRRAEFAVGRCLRTEESPPPSLPQVVKVTKTTIVEKCSSPLPVDSQSTKCIAAENIASAVPTVYEVGKSMNTENSSPKNQDAGSTDMVEKAPSTPVSDQDTNGLEKSPVQVQFADTVTKSVGSAVSAASSRPSKAVVVPGTCPANVIKVSATPEPRVTRSRQASIGSVEASSGARPLRRQSAAVDIPASVTRHSQRGCKRVSTDSATKTPTHNIGSRDSIGSRVELRPRPPPRATTPK